MFHKQKLRDARSLRMHIISLSDLRVDMKRWLVPRVLNFLVVKNKESLLQERLFGTQVYFFSMKLLLLWIMNQKRLFKKR